MRACIIDLETDGIIPSKCNLKYFGGLDCTTGEITMLDHNCMNMIKTYIEGYDILIGFNLKGFDLKVLENYEVDLKYKTIIDLWEILAPKGDRGFGMKNKNRLSDINPSLKFPNYKLNTIVKVLGLDQEGKFEGKEVYEILKKESWTVEEIKEIEKYLEQDLKIEYKLFLWYKELFEPLEKYLSGKDVQRLKYLNCTSGSLAYKFITNQTQREESYNDKDTTKVIKQESVKIEGGHHINPKYEKVRGNIICKDFVSHYPTIIIMNQLHDKEVNDVVEMLLNERLKAKANGDKITALALKVPLNSMYGIMGQPTFKNIYNSRSASECTRIGRELLKQYAKSLDIAGFDVLYGFTDSVYCGIPKPLDESDLDIVTKCFIEKTKKTFVKPIDSYNLGVEKRLRFMWFIDKGCNNYLWIDDENKIGVKGGLFNKNCPKCVLRIFDEYISNKIKNELDVNFTEKELNKKLIEYLILNPELSGQEYNPKTKESYELTTNLYYKISNMYGSGKICLIPNKKGVGVNGCSDISYCTVEEFKQNKLLVEDIDIKRMMRYFKPFYTTTEKVVDI